MKKSFTGCRKVQGCYRRLTVRNSGAVGGLHDVGTPPACRGYKLVALKAIPISTPPRLVRHPLLPLAQKKLQRTSEGREKPGTISSPALPFFH
jgi:hypothetical protein